MRLRDIHEMGDLRDMGGSDVGDLLDELRAIAAKRGTELLQQGRVQARRAVGAPDARAVGSAFVVGVALGAVVGAAVALLMTPLPGREARQRLAQRAEEMREHMPEIRHGSNGQEPYPAEAATPADAPTRIGGPAV